MHENIKALFNNGTVIFFLLSFGLWVFKSMEALVFLTFSN